MFNKHVFISIFKKSLDDRCPQIAAALSYATLLALIPVTVLIYKIFSTAFVNPELQLKTQAFIFESLSPEMAQEVQQYLLSGVLQSSNLSLLGFLMLLISVLSMMYSIDTALNSIWKINTPRYLVRRFLVYLVLLIFGPLAISFSLFASAYITSLPLISSVLGLSFDWGILNALPFIVLWAAFTMLYKWIPDHPVKWLHAFIGATFAACLFQLAKIAFALYVGHFSNYEILYGALATIPLLLIWIYSTWLIVLTGAEIAYFMGIQNN